MNLTGAAFPSALRLGVARGVVEIKQFARERDSMAFGFAMPVVFMLLLGAIFGDQPIGHGLRYDQALVPAMLTMGIASTSLVSVGMWIAVDRDNGTLRRLLTTPMPRPAYFVGKIVMIVVVGVAESVLVVAVGVVAFDVRLPSDPGKWLLFCWVAVLAFATCGALGVALSSVPRSARSAGAVVQLPVLVLEFVSGIFIPYGELPGWLQRIGALFPLKWIAQGLRAAFLPDTLAVREPAHAWETGRVSLVLACWLVVALALCVTTFRWRRRYER